MNYTEKNRVTLENIKQYNDSLKDLTIINNELIFNGKRIDISKFDISLLLDETKTKMFNSLPVLTAEDVFKIISIHALTLESQTPKFENKNETELEMLKVKNPNLKNITISTKKNDYGTTEEYINIVDSNGNDHLLFNYYHNDLMALYMEALQTYGKSDLTAEQLYEVFKRRCKEVSLDDTYNLNQSNKTSEEFKTKISSFDKQHQDDRHYALANEENDIIISNDHTVTSYEKDQKGNLIQNDFNNSLDNNSEERLNISEQNNELQINEEQQEIIKLISEEKFMSLVNSPNPLDEKETSQVNLFNSYIEDLLVYRDYLLPELEEILNRFETFINNLANLNDEELNNNQLNELKKYYELVEHKEHRVIEGNNKNLDNQLKLLLEKKPDKQEGFISIGVILSLIGLIIIITGIIAILLIK